ncbi:hypothetical protein SCUCBS95973_004590 [Sporothrix curviconia]|uniref:SprT-like domain-containing protein n=1 Tax=Sporothrix curviconia TaxID=1260050 RepID=A0ABP0BRL4_9PEZI
MAFWVRGGGEQSFCSSDGEERRRPYYVDDEVHLSAHRSRQKQALTVDEDENEDEDEDGSNGHPHRTHSNGQKQHCFMIRHGSLQQDWPVYRPQIPECNVPYPSIETPHDVTVADMPVFFVLHEESSMVPGERRSLTLQSPLPTRDEYSPSPAPTNWSDGSDLKAFATDHVYGIDTLHVAQTPKLQRYEDWRDRNRQHGAGREQLDTSRSVSPSIVLPRLPSRGPTPDNSLLHPNTHGHGRRVFRTGVVSFDYDRDGCHHTPYQYEKHAEQQVVEILSCPVQDHGPAIQEEAMMTDAEAAASVTTHLANFNRRCPSSRHERILLGLIHPKSANAEFDLDNSALESIFSAANEIFFNGRLTRRVQWDWSDTNSNPQYDNKIIGHTSLRRAQSGGFETFILLSTPILKSREYSRRLLISAFLHELIHCYLFICCGWGARESGGHTDGFRYIADTIDHWAGRENLFLCQVEADLEQFRQPPDRGLAAEGQGQPMPADSYIGYSLASPVFYNARLCSNTDTDWERCVHDRWERHRDGYDSHTYT